MLKQFLMPLFALVLCSNALSGSCLDVLESQIHRELELLGYPTPAWRTQDDELLDVAVIGGGMLGTSVAGALRLEGVYNVEVFDAAEKGKEGPWLTTARMKTLRSGKSLQGPALGIPRLTFRAWYEAKYGKHSWDRLGKIPTQLWGKYLIWMKKVLNITVHSRCRLEKIEPSEDGTLMLYFSNHSAVRARKVVLATGRGGFGGYELPSFVQGLPARFWGHTNQILDPGQMKAKHVTVIGAGASAFDAAAYALEHGAKKVSMIMRREAIPKDNFFAVFGHMGFKHGYYFLSDEKRCELFLKAYAEGIPPPAESIQRIESFANFELLSSTCIEQIDVRDNHLVIQTSRGPHKTDFLFLGTGYAVDGSKQTELKPFHDAILLWKDRLNNLPEKLGRFPYLGQHFEFLEKTPGVAPFVQHIHCFNYGAFLSHGRISGDIDCIDVGIKRLAQGIAIKLFLQDMYEDVQIVPSCPNTCQTGLDGSFCMFGQTSKRGELP